MDDILTLDEQKEILLMYILNATGRPRELLDTLLHAFPEPLSADQIRHRMSMTGKHALKSVVRNARIFIELHEHYDALSDQCYYSLDDTCIQISKMNRIMNLLHKRW
ncbi:hypothetical protein [Methylophaga thalassica]|uniref:hypothetical protein n=1 Tax=Methylophaga aminisulfidivorans TaxID=230105 RepID=UPI003A8E1282